MSIFSKIPVKRKPRSKFNLSHERKLSLRMGGLYPILYEPIIPGDSVKGKSEIFMRLAPMVYPIMQRIHAVVYYFFVPNRLIWDEWEDFIGRGEDGTKDPAHPVMAISETRKSHFQKGKLPDYFGIPPVDQALTLTTDTLVSALPFRAMLLIYNEYFRDQNLEQEIPFDKTSGLVSSADSVELTTLRTKAWKKDYFTSALPWAQRGGEVILPVTGTGTVTYRSTSDLRTSDGGNAAAGNAAIDASSKLTDLSNDQLRVENIQQIDVNGTSVSINELRSAYRLQEWLENNARAGSRYIEQILSHFGVRSSDARLQRPEYLGSGKFNVQISEVLNQTGDRENPAPTLDSGGAMYGHGVSVGKANGFKRSFEEHGQLIGILCVMPEANYFQGIPRKFTRFNFMEYPFPEFANLGEQAIQNKEIFVDYVDTANNDLEFGYTPRYAEFKYGLSSIHGDFRDNLNRWHYAQIYATKPALNADFVRYKNDNRIFNAQDQDIDNLYCQIWNQISAIRPLPYYGVPIT